MPTLRFEPLGEQHDTAAFRCGATFLDWFLSHEALTLHKASVSRTYVLIDTEDAQTDAQQAVAGYITLEAGLAPTSFLSLLPEDTLARLVQQGDGRREGVSPLANLPVVYLAYLARDMKHRGKGYGELLLVEALRHAERVARRIGASGMFLVATGEGIPLYEGYGFRAYGDYERKMFLSMGEIRKLLAEGGIQE
jgi:ribosomal protein S18 acetylase RimI-like enzyme